MIELDAGVPSRTKERRVFLFEQIVIFSELLRKGSLTPGYMFKRSIKVRTCGGEKGQGRAKFGDVASLRQRHGMRQDPEHGRSQPDHL